MKEFGIPSKFIMWIMKTGKTVTYRFNINGHLTNGMTTRRGIRQGDPISPSFYAHDGVSY